MTQENVEVVRRFLLLEVDEALTYVDPDIVWNPAEEPATQGHDAVRASLVRWKSEWDDYELLPEEFEHMGDRVVAAVRVRGRGRGSGVQVDARFYEVYTLRKARSSAWISSRSGQKPSKPSGCGSRRCRRRTSSWLTRPIVRSTGATSLRCSHWSTPKPSPSRAWPPWRAVTTATRGSAAGGSNCSTLGPITSSRSSRSATTERLRWHRSRLGVAPPIAASR